MNLFMIQIDSMRDSFENPNWNVGIECHKVNPMEKNTIL